MSRSTQEGDATLSSTGQHAVIPPEQQSIEGLTREEIFDILSNHRRRYVLRYLQSQESDSDLRTLSEQIAAWENDIDPSQVNSKQRMRAYTALRQSHLPKMDRQGVIEFDSQSGTVRLTETADALEEYLDMEATDTDSRGLLLLGLGTIGLLISVGCFFDLYPLGSVPDIASGLLMSAVVATIGVQLTMGNGSEDSP